MLCRSGIRFASVGSPFPTPHAAHRRCGRSTSCRSRWRCCERFARPPPRVPPWSRDETCRLQKLSPLSLRTVNRGLVVEHLQQAYIQRHLQVVYKDAFAPTEPCVSPRTRCRSALSAMTAFDLAPLSFIRSDIVCLKPSFKEVRHRHRRRARAVQSRPAQVNGVARALLKAHRPVLVIGRCRPRSARRRRRVFIRAARRSQVVRVSMVERLAPVLRGLQLPIFLCGSAHGLLVALPRSAHRLMLTCYAGRV